MSESRYMTSKVQELQAVIDGPEIWMIGEFVPVPEDHEPGRRRIHHGSALILFLVATQIFGSHRAAARELDNPDHWNRYVAAFKARYAHRPELWPALATPIRRCHYAWFKRCHISSQDWFVDRARAIARQAGVTHANNLGLCTAETAGSLTHPSPLNVIGADGKVIKPRFNPRRLDRETGELVGGRRRDPDANYYKTGGMVEKAYGIKFVIASTRGPAANQRVILDVAHAPLEGGEAEHAIALLDQLLPQTPHAQVVVYDGAFRGIHLQRLMTKHGIIALARLHNSRGQRTLERHYGPATVRRPDGTTASVDLHLVDGAAHIKQLDEAGNVHLIALDRVKLTRRQLRNGTWTWYILLQVPSAAGGGTIRLRCDQAPGDDDRRFNRAEHLRMIPDRDPDWWTVMLRRTDSESGNRVLDDSFWRERAHSIGARAQLFDLIGHMIQRNCRAEEIHRRRRADAAPLAA